MDIDPVTKVQAWIVANETVAAQHHALLMEQVVDDHLKDMVKRLVESDERNPRQQVNYDPRGLC